MTDHHIPDDLQFSTAGTERDPEVIEISIDGHTCHLIQPADSLMVMLASSFSASATNTDKVSAMLNLVNASLDEPGRMILRQKMFDARNGFDDGVIGKLANTILKQWAKDIADGSDLSLDRAAPNRATRRRAPAKKALAKKAPAKKLPAKKTTAARK